MWILYRVVFVQGARFSKEQQGLGFSEGIREKLGASLFGYDFCSDSRLIESVKLGSDLIFLSSRGFFFVKQGY